MSQYSGFWKIITPGTRKDMYNTIATDTYDPRTTSVSSLTAVSWYSKVMQGHGSRLSAYKQYDTMDGDIDISRSLDIIAEEVSTKDDKTRLPFEIQYFKEDNQDVSDVTSVTLRTATRQFAEIQKLEKRVFGIARSLIKFGDCFFRKVSDTKSWVWVDPANVHGVELDEHGNKVAYHLKTTMNNAQSAFGKLEQYEVVPAHAMIHFTMSDDMGSWGPFGQSVLRPIIRTYRQMAMIEDAIVIYRIVRAPERRVFYIDTGNMPPQRVQSYLEQVKNDIRQKRMPGSHNGKDFADGQYDPMSIQEDMFFPVTASGRGSRVETLPGGTEDFGTTLLKTFQDKLFRGLRIPTSYMSGTEGQGAQYNDGKVGIAYIEEMRFANFVRRIQDQIDTVIDREFKIYLKVCGIQIDDEIFRLRLPDPANFALYRQAALDADLVNAFNNVEGSKYLSRRFVLKRYLGLSDDEIQMNEVMIKEERGIRENGAVSDLQQIYDPAVYDNREAVDIDDSKDSPGGGMDDIGGGFFDEPKDEPPPPEQTPPEDDKSTV
jgi:Bacteriophage T4-like portal protein (Gp20)